MQRFRLFAFMSIVFVCLLALSARLGAQTIPLTVDATGTQQKLLHVHEVIPVSAGKLTLYYPKWIPGEHGPNGPISSLTGLKFAGGGNPIPWVRDTLDVFTFHLEIPADVKSLDANFDIIEPQGYSATDKLMVLEWNTVVLYLAGTPAQQQIFEAALKLPEGWKFGTSLPINKQSGNQIEFKPISLDMLVDSPVIAIGEPGVAGRGGWFTWRRGTDYYDEGDLLWLEVATLIHRESNGAKSIDDFCIAFHGGSNKGPEVKTYTFEQLVSALNSIAPYDWAAFFKTRLESTSADAPVGGIENGGWKVVMNEKPPRSQERRGGAGYTYSLGLQIGPDGTVSDAIVGGPAFQAGIAPGMKVIGVNSHVYTADVLADALRGERRQGTDRADGCVRRLHSHFQCELSWRATISAPGPR